MKKIIIFLFLLTLQCLAKEDNSLNILGLSKGLPLQKITNIVGVNNISSYEGENIDIKDIDYLNLEENRDTFNLIFSNKNFYSSLKEDTYIIKLSPTQNSFFSDLKIIVPKKYGLVRILAYTKLKKTNEYGDEIKSDFNNLLNLLSKKHGKSIKFDYLSYNSLWTAEEDYTMALCMDERKLKAFWLKEEGAKFYNSGIISVILEPIVISKDYYFFVLTYDFNNYNDYIEELNKENNDDLLI